MEQRISVITLGVRSLDASTAFYERLGWTRAMKDAEGVAFFQAGGIVFGLYPLAEFQRDYGYGADDVGPRSGIVLAHNTRERSGVDDVLAEAGPAGATITRPAADTFWGGYAGAFADPDGYVWEIAWNPGFPIDDAGNVTVPA